MSKQRRKRGERNWAEPAPTATSPQLPKQKKRRSQKQFFHLRVKCFNEAPHQFLVTDIQHDVEWLVQVGVDATLTIDERPDRTHVKDRTVLAAIYRGWPHLKG